MWVWVWVWVWGIGSSVEEYSITKVLLCCAAFLGGNWWKVGVGLRRMERLRGSQLGLVGQWPKTLNWKARWIMEMKERVTVCSGIR